MYKLIGHGINIRKVQKVAIPSHFSPVNCFGHVQTGVPSLSVHVPPFRHGFGSQLLVAKDEDGKN